MGRHLDGFVARLAAGFVGGWHRFGGREERNRSITPETSIKSGFKNLEGKYVCCGGGYKDGPNTDNDAYKKACSGDEYGTLDWALKRCSGEETCTWLHDWDCDGDNWRWCKGEIPHAGGKACTKKKEGPGEGCTASERFGLAT